MSDSRLRECERRWLETGSVQDEAKLLLEKVRVGQLSPHSLALAGFLGHAASNLIVGGQVTQLEDLRVWGENLGKFGKEGCVRAAVAAAQFGDARPLAGIEAAEDWIRCPCESHAEQAGGVADRGYGLALALEGREWCLATASAGCAQAAALESALSAGQVAGGVAYEIAFALDGCASPDTQATVAQAIRMKLLPWILAQPTG